MKTYLTRSIFAAFAGLAIACSASALTIGDTRNLGSIDPGSPADASAEAGYITTLVGLSPSAIGTIDLSVPLSGPNFRIYDRYLADPAASYPAATATGALSGLSPASSVDVTGWTYLLAKYGDTSYVWYLGGLSGVQSVPLNEPGVIPGTGTPSVNVGTQGQSHYSLFNQAPRVPDGGSTIALLGLGLALLAIARRKLV